MTKLEYPVARRDETIVEKYHGVEVSTHFPLIDFKGYVKFSLSLSLCPSLFSPFHRYNYANSSPFEKFLFVSM